MMKDPWSRFFGLLALGIALLSASLFFFGGRGRIQGSLAEEIRLYLAVRAMIRDQYVLPVEEEELIRSALKGMVASLDPYSRYYDPKEQRELEAENAGKFVGIGVVLEPSQPPLTVLFSQPGSPAAKAGIGVGDRILAADGVDFEGLSLEEAREKVRGPEGSALTLRVRPFDGSGDREVLLQRGALHDASVAHARILETDRGIGYLWVSGFTEQTLEEFDRAIARLRLQGMQALILDLRFNPGGVLDAAVGLVNRFLCDGVIVSTQGRQAQSRREHRASAKDCNLAGIPLVVLVNGASASASEVVAGAVQDWKLGTIVGTRSYGKGMVQTLKPLGEDGLVKLTTSFYYTPQHRNFERDVAGKREGGILPDLVATLPKSSEDALRRSLNRFDPPEPLIEPVRKFRLQIGAEEEKGEDAQLDAALTLLRNRPIPGENR